MICAPHSRPRRRTTRCALFLPRDERRDGDRYAQAAGRPATWERDGVLVADTAPRLYSYRMEFRDGPATRHTRGVIGALALPERGDQSVLPHERTMPKAKSDRLALLRSTRANVDPIWGLSLAEGLTGRLEPTSPWPVRRPRRRRARSRRDRRSHALEEIRGLVGGSALVLADGHHRFETACTYRDELRGRASRSVAQARS